MVCDADKRVCRLQIDQIDGLQLKVGQVLLLKKYFYKYSFEGPLFLRTTSPKDLIIFDVFSPKVAEILTEVSLKLIKQRSKNRKKKKKLCSSLLPGNENRCFFVDSAFDPIVEQFKL